MISRNECAAAIKCAQEKHTTVVIDADLAYLVLTRVLVHKANMIFREAIRFALNDAQLHTIETRRAHASVVGFYFGPHGTFVRARNTAKKNTPQKKYAPPIDSNETVIEPSGQHAWRI